MWSPKGTPALVVSSSARYCQRASYYSAACPITGESEALPMTGNSSAETSAALSQQLLAHRKAPFVLFWDNAPSHGGDPFRACPARPTCVRTWAACRLHPDFNADEQL